MKIHGVVLASVFASVFGVVGQLFKSQIQWVLVFLLKVGKYENQAKSTDRNVVFWCSFWCIWYKQWQLLKSNIHWVLVVLGQSSCKATLGSECFVCQQTDHR